MMNEDESTPKQRMKRRAAVFLGALLGTFILLRVSLSFSPDSDFNVGRYNIHHLFTGLVLITIGGVPLAVLEAANWKRTAATLVFGVGLGMALDEWVYLISTDGSNASYLLPVSFWGGVIMIGLACAYTLVIVVLSRNGR
jgi:hypothetical protein